MTSRTEQKEKLRFEIMEAALDKFVHCGYAATKIKDIADAVGMSMGLLFHYFDSKESLYTELIKLGVSAPKKMFESITATEPIRVFEICAESTLNFASQSLFTAKMFVLMSSAYYNEGIPDEARQLAMGIDFYTSFIPILTRGQMDGTIRSGAPQALSVAFWTAIQGAVEVHALNPEIPLPKAEWIMDIIRNKENIYSWQRLFFGNIYCVYAWRSFGGGQRLSKRRLAPNGTEYSEYICKVRRKY